MDDNTTTTQLYMHPSIIPILTSMSVFTNNGKNYLQPHYAQVNHNAVNNEKTLHITHTALGNPFHDPSHDVTQLSNFGTDACIFFGFDTKVIYRFILFCILFYNTNNIPICNRVDQKNR